MIINIEKVKAEMKLRGKK